VPFQDISNNDNGGGTSSTAWRLYCDTTASRITDWGQLTNLTGSTVVGSGTPIGVPIQIANVNPASGTESTFAHFVDSGQLTSGNDTCANTNTNHSTLVCAGAATLENNASQFGDCAAADFPVADATRAADQAAEIATTLYFFSNGVFNSNIHARSLALSDGTKVAAIKINTENGTQATTSPTGTLMNNTYPTARTLYNIYRTGKNGNVNQGNAVRASVASFLNWICDSNVAFTKAIDLNTGVSYNSEITSAVQTQFGFIRLNSSTASPNNSCQPVTVAPAVSDGVENSTTTITSTTGFAQANQTPVHVGDLVTGTGIPTGDHVASIVDANTLTLTAAATATATGVTFTFNIFDPNS
jgi:hypothetical protein